MYDDDLPLFATRLQEEGFVPQVTVTICGTHNTQGILISGIGFFPLWELNAPENAGHLAARDFESIKSGRKPEWQPDEPRFWPRDPLPENHANCAIPKRP